MSYSGQKPRRVPVSVDLFIRLYIFFLNASEYCIQFTQRPWGSTIAFSVVLLPIAWHMVGRTTSGVSGLLGCLWFCKICINLDDVFAYGGRTPIGGSSDVDMSLAPTLYYISPENNVS